MNLLERIDRWATLAPAAIAHISGERTLTYGELRTRSDTLAAYFTRKFGDNRAPIAVLGHREPEMLVAFLGAVKSGRPYVPLDTALPEPRIDNILATARASLLLTPNDIATLSASGTSPAGRGVGCDDPFYIIFTSGSTGMPKGVVITLACLEHFVDWMLAEQRFAERAETFLNQAPFSFDLSVMDLYCCLSTGGTLFSLGGDLIANPKLLYRHLASSGITTWVSTPSFARMCLVERKFDTNMLPGLQRFLFCGEALLPETAASLLSRFAKAEIWNTYGPTEATVATTSVRIDAEMLRRHPTLPVGRAMPGTDVFLADSNRGSLTAAVRGEIIIAGPNVSPGYLARPDLTANAFFEYRGQRAYRTGDRGFWRDDLLFFEGRMDDQIKLNGYRIELGDIEVNLRALPLVRDAVVVPAIKNGVAQSLLAFVVLASQAKASSFELTNLLRKQLGQRLPAYMLPRKFRFLDALPMTVNGKTDRRQLAELL